MQACGTIEKACVEQCTAGGTLPTATAAEPRTSPVPAPSSTAHGTGSHTAEAFSYDDHTFAVLAEHFRFSAAVPGVPCVRITSDCKATSSFAKCVASCVKARKPHGPGAAHCRGKSGGAQSHRHSDARWAGPCSRCGQRLRPQPRVQPATSISEEGHRLLLLDQKANTLRIVAYLSRLL